MTSACSGRVTWRSSVAQRGIAVHSGTSRGRCGCESRSSRMRGAAIAHAGAPTKAHRAAPRSGAVTGGSDGALEPGLRARCARRWSAISSAHGGRLVESPESDLRIGVPSQKGHGNSACTAWPFQYVETRLNIPDSAPLQRRDPAEGGSRCVSLSLVA